MAENPQPSVKPRVLALVGPTGAGKSQLALDIAIRLGAEIVSVDSAMVYRGMDIGTDKPSLDDLARVPHHMIDIIEPAETLSVAKFQKIARDTIADILARKRIPLLVGGSGLYFRAVVDPLVFPGSDPRLREMIEAGGNEEELYERLLEKDPDAAARIERSNPRRVIRALEVIELTGKPFSSFRTAWDHYESIYDLVVAGLSWEREELDVRIDARVDAQISRDLLGEVKSLAEQGMRRSLTSVQALGYAQMLEYLDGLIDLKGAVEKIKRRTRKFARRQLSWFRADPRISWFVGRSDLAADFLLEAALTGGRFT